MVSSRLPRLPFKAQTLLRALGGLPAKDRKVHLERWMAARHWYPKAAAAQRAMVGRTTVDRLVAGNQVRRVKILGRWFVHLPSVLARYRHRHPELGFAVGLNPSCTVCGTVTPDGETCAQCAKIVFSSIGATLGGDDDEEPE